eukprot:3179456-Rhodomonas_salina.1
MQTARNNGLCSSTEPQLLLGYSTTVSSRVLNNGCFPPFKLTESALSPLSERCFVCCSGAVPSLPPPPPPHDSHSFSNWAPLPSDAQMGRDDIGQRLNPRP